MKKINDPNELSLTWLICKEYFLMGEARGAQEKIATKFNTSQQNVSDIIGKKKKKSRYKTFLAIFNMVKELIEEKNDKSEKEKQQNT